MAHRRSRISRRAIEELGADVDFILAVVLALPNLLSRAMTVSLRGGLNGDDRFRQRVVEVDAIQNVEQALELSHDVRHLDIAHIGYGVVNVLRGHENMILPVQTRLAYLLAAA